MAMSMESRRQHATWILEHISAAEKILENIESWRKAARYAVFDQRFDRLAEMYEQTARAEYVAAGGRDNFGEVLEIASVAEVVLGKG